MREPLVPGLKSSARHTLISSGFPEIWSHSALIALYNPPDQVRPAVWARAACAKASPALCSIAAM